MCCSTVVPTAEAYKSPITSIARPKAAFCASFRGFWYMLVKSQKMASRCGVCASAVMTTASRAAQGSQCPAVSHPCDSTPTRRSAQWMSATASSGCSSGETSSPVNCSSSASSSCRFGSGFELGCARSHAVRRSRISPRCSTATIPSSRSRSSRSTSSNPSSRSMSCTAVVVVTAGCSDGASSSVAVFDDAHPAPRTRSATTYMIYLGRQGLRVPGRMLRCFDAGGPSIATPSASFAGTLAFNGTRVKQVQFFQRA